MTEEYKEEEPARTGTGTGMGGRSPQGSRAGGLPVPPLVMTATGAALTRVFAHVPGDLSVHPFLDYLQKHNMQVFKDNSVPLPTRFDGSPGSIKVFTKASRDRVDKASWSSILTIPVRVENVDLLDGFSRVTVDKVWDHAKATWAAMSNSQQDQNSAMLYHCISASITTKAQLKILMYNQSTL